MKRFHLAALAVLAVTLALPVHADPAWKAFENATANFSVDMPGTPKEKTTTQQTAAGPIGLYQASVILGDSAYFVSYSDLPPAAAKGDPAKMLAGARDGAAKQVNGKILADRELKLAGKYPGREFKVSAQGMELTQRVYWVAPRLYQLNMGCPAGKCSDAQFARYLDSFKLLK